MSDIDQKLIAIVGIFALLVLVWGQSFEGFESPAVSSSQDISGGASEYYNWGYKDIPDEVTDKIPHIKHLCPRCHKSCYIPVPYKKPNYPCPHCQTKIHIKNDFYFIKTPDCGKCDITKNKNIDKYVLKSSVPPCPDMSQYVKKSQLHPNNGGGGGGHGGGGNGGGGNGGGKRMDCPKCPICPICPKCPTGGNGGNGGNGDSSPIYYPRRQPEQRRHTLKDDYKITSESRRQQTDFGLNGDDGEPGPGNRTGPGRAPDLDPDTDDAFPATNGKPSPYFKDFAYNNRGSGRVKAYNSVWNVFDKVY